MSSVSPLPLFLSTPRRPPADQLMADIMEDDISKEELSARLEGSESGGAVAEGVAPGVLAAVIVGVLCAIALLFSMAIIMDRWSSRYKFGDNARSSQMISTKITILDEMSPEPMSDPPAAAVVPVTSQDL